MLALRFFARFGYVPTMLGGLNLIAVYVVAAAIQSFGSVRYSRSLLLYRFYRSGRCLLSNPGTTHTLTFPRM